MELPSNYRKPKARALIFVNRDRKKRIATLGKSKWNYGYKQLSKFIAENPQEKFLIDQNRGKPAYIELAFYLKIDPDILQKAADPAIKKDYYNLDKFNPNYRIGNLEFKAIEWEKDICIKQILVGDELMVSQVQAKEHYLTEVFKVSETRGLPVFIGFKTDPEKKCPS